MSARLKILSALVAIFFSTLACSTILGEAPTASIPAPSEAPFVEPNITEEPLVEIPATQAPATCPVVTNQMVAAGTAEGSEESGLAEEVYLVTYTVSGNEIADPYYEQVKPKLKDAQNDSAAQQQTWDYFSVIIPADQRAVIGEYSIFTDGNDGTLAAVTQTQNDPNVWALEVDIADIADKYSLTFTLIHEFGHLLTLGPSQVPPSKPVFNNPDDNDIYLKEVSKCPQYFPGEGCANADSYINAYYNQFWAGLHEEWNKINLEEDEDLYYEKLDDFYIKYEDQFLTSYATTNPEEDMAETWAFFVLDATPSGNTIAEKKILFFYQYPELVQLRQEILNNVCMSFSE